ncbi:MAG: LPS export ABC transporter periplasmic protein LptC [Candidatus Goldiibacteriota bacterium]
MKKILYTAVLAAVSVFAACGAQEEARPRLPVSDKAGDMPNYVIEGFVLESTESGRIVWSVNASAAQVFELKGKAYAQNVEIEMSGGESGGIFLKGNKAVIYMENNFMEIEGDVYGVSDDGAVLRTEKLYWDDKERRIFTDEKVTIIKDGAKLEGAGFESDPGMRNFEINKNVEMIAERIKEKEKEGE